MKKTRRMIHVEQLLADQSLRRVLRGELKTKEDLELAKTLKAISQGNLLMRMKAQGSA